MQKYNYALFLFDWLKGVKNMVVQNFGSLVLSGWWESCGDLAAGSVGGDC